MWPFVLELAPVVGLVAACAALAVSRATFYRRQVSPTPRRSRPAPPRALPADERAQVLEVLNSQRFADKAPAQVYADLLDDEKYLCSVRTMYRILDASGEVRERRDQLRHAGYTKPELLATQPNQVWSWDITKLKGPAAWTYFSLYLALDIFSRYVVGWMVSERENATLGHDLVRIACERQGIQPGQLTIHADRGSPMIAKSTALLYADLGISKSHSRPHVSNDNPFSEAQFKTLKYRPDCPDRFGSVQDASTQLGRLIDWYNHEHKHSSLALLTPADVHYGRSDAIIAARQRVLDRAHAAHPERFVRGQPKHPSPPAEAWINPPPRTEEASQ